VHHHRPHRQLQDKLRQYEIEKLAEDNRISEDRKQYLWDRARQEAAEQVTSAKGPICRAWTAAISVAEKFEHDMNNE